VTWGVPIRIELISQRVRQQKGSVSSPWIPSRVAFRGYSTLGTWLGIEARGRREAGEAWRPSVRDNRTASACWKAPSATRARHCRPVQAPHPEFVDRAASRKWCSVSSLAKWCRHS